MSVAWAPSGPRAWATCPATPFARCALRSALDLKPFPDPARTTPRRLLWTTVI